MMPDESGAVPSDRFVVSVIIPTAGHRPVQLEAAIAAVREQTIADQIEIILVDDSRDGLDSAALADSAGPIPIVVVRSEDRTVGQRSLGVRESGGRWIAYLDDDDQWLPTKLEKQVAMAE